MTSEQMIHIAFIALLSGLGLLAAVFACCIPYMVVTDRRWKMNNVESDDE